MALTTVTSGDAALIEATEASLHSNGTGANWDRVALTLVDLRAASIHRHAVFGGNAHTNFDIASLTKTMVGHLFAIAIKAGACAPTDTLGTYLPVTGGLASRTLQQLATHRSGLARNISTWTEDVGPSVAIDTLDDLADAAEAVYTGGNVGTYTYSNIGGALLGQAVAAALSMDFVDAMRESVFEPMGMHNTFVAYSTADMPLGSIVGRDATTGAAKTPNSLRLLAPTAGVKCNAADMGRFMFKILVGSAAGIDAIRARDWETEFTRKIGWFWRRTTSGNTISHTGSLNGFHSYVILRRDLRRGVAIFSNTTHNAHVTVAEDILINFT